MGRAFRAAFHAFDPLEGSRCLSTVVSGKAHYGEHQKSPALFNLGPGEGGVFPLAYDARRSTRAKSPLAQKMVARPRPGPEPVSTAPVGKQYRPLSHRNHSPALLRASATAERSDFRSGPNHEPPSFDACHRGLFPGVVTVTTR